MPTPSTPPSGTLAGSSSRVTCWWSTRRQRSLPRSTAGCPTASPWSSTCRARCPATPGGSRHAGPMRGRPRPSARRVPSRSRSSAAARWRCWPPSPAPGGSGWRCCTPTRVLEYAAAHGRPIRYRYVPRDWSLARYQTVFARDPGSAEMPSASRPFSHRLVTDLVSCGVVIAPLLLHTGVSSLEGGETPYPERYHVPSTTAATINALRRRGGRVIAAGTTVVRALATVTDDRGSVHPGHGWTDVVVTPASPVPSIDGLLTGWHEPASSHLQMLEAFAG